MIYCNYDDFQYEFSKTYRENVDQHSEFFYLGKYLKYAVNECGTEIGNGKPKRFYHGVSEMLIFDKIVGHMALGWQIFCPLSTSTSIEVALQFAGDKSGSVIEFGALSFDLSEFSVYFDCCWLSDFSNEAEHLFVQNPSYIRINNIIHPQTCVQYDNVLKAISILETITTAYELKHDITRSQMLLIGKIIAHQLSGKDISVKFSTEFLDQYAKILINTYFQNKNSFSVDMKHEKKFGPLFMIFFLSETEW
eukprot:282872_1